MYNKGIHTIMDGDKLLVFHWRHSRHSRVWDDLSLFRFSCFPVFLVFRSDWHDKSGGLKALIM